MKKVLRLVDYNFQSRKQLTEAYDDSNSLRYICKDFEICVVGRFNIKEPEIHIVRDGTGGEYKVFFLPFRWTPATVMKYVFDMAGFDVIHLHGTSAWPQYLIYPGLLRKNFPNAKFIFSPAGGCKGPPDFLNEFDVVIVNHPKQIDRMRCDKERIIVRKRSADPSVFHYVKKTEIKYDCVYVAGFIPLKRIDLMIDTVLETCLSLVVLGDFRRLWEHKQYIARYIRKKNASDQIFLHDFIPQTDMAKFLSGCRIWVWPNIPPENLVTNTNRSVIEALACGLPLLVGEQAFAHTEFLVNGFNGYTYRKPSSFKEKARLIMTSPKTYRNNSAKLFGDHFNFHTYFIEFYKNLYGSE